MLQDHINIFYTDDDPEDQMMFVDAVREVSEHAKVTTQISGDDLIKMLDNPPPSPHVIFLDLNMPLKNGYEILKEIRNLKGNNSLPVVIFTTSDHSTAIETARQLGANMYVTKPLTYSHLKRVLRYVLSINWNTFSSKGSEFVYRGN